MKTSRAMLLGILIGMMVMTLMPVSAATNAPSGDGVQPKLIPHFGGNDCDDPKVGTTATEDFTIVSPANTTYTDPTSGVKFTLGGIGGSRTFNWSMTSPDASPGWAAYDVVVKGGTNSNHYDYADTPSVGVQTADTALHPPLKGSRYDNLSHISFCYDLPPFTISGTKFHDRDSDGVDIESEADLLEEPLANWTISAYRLDGSFVTSGDTDASGNYKLSVGAGTFIVCEAKEAATAPFGWQQTFPNASTPNVANCSNVTVPTGAEPLHPAGRTVVVNADVVGINFRNVKGVTIGCGDTVTLNETGKPSATVTVPAAGCSSPDKFMVFDVGVDPNEENVSQFVVFGGDPTGTVVFTQNINWQPETANYDGDGNLIVPPTLVVLQPGGLPTSPGAICGTGQPNATVKDCRASRTINEGGAVAAGMMQVSEVWKFLGDPTRAR